MFKRSDRLRELFLQEISRILSSLKDPGLLGFVTVTDLQLSPDMKTARVYYSILGSRADRESTAKALERSAGHVRSELQSRIDLRYTPKVLFIYDETPERANRIENLLHRLDEEKAGSPLPGPGEAAEGLDRLKAVASGRRARDKGKPKRRR